MALIVNADKKYIFDTTRIFHKFHYVSFMFIYSIHIYSTFNGKRTWLTFVKLLRLWVNFDVYHAFLINLKKICAFIWFYMTAWTFMQSSYIKLFPEYLDGIIIKGQLISPFFFEIFSYIMSHLSAQSTTQQSDNRLSWTYGFVNFVRKFIHKKLLSLFMDFEHMTEC